LLEAADLGQQRCGLGLPRGATAGLIISAYATGISPMRVTVAELALKQKLPSDQPHP
jgi:hypothetical protein